MVSIHPLLPSCCRQPNLTVVEEGRWLFQCSQSDCSLPYCVLDCTLCRLTVWQRAEIQCPSHHPISQAPQTACHPSHHPLSHIIVSMSNCVAVCTGRAGGRVRFNAMQGA